MPDPATTSTALCPFCFSAIADQEEATNCPACRTRYHCDCWKENGGCAVYGCTQVPVVESRRGIEIPAAYWGQDHKPCPSCQQEILAAALRCRHCGAVFASARPENAAEFQNRTVIAAAASDTQRMIWWIFIVSVLPFTAPIGVAWGWWWNHRNRDSISALPPFYGAISRIGFYAGLVVTVTIALLAAVYFFRRAT